MNLLRKTLLLTLMVAMAGLGMAALPCSLQAAVSVECPPDTDGVDTDGDTIVDNDHVCIHLAATDGFSKMADETILYNFGFVEVTPPPVTTNIPWASTNPVNPNVAFHSEGVIAQYKFHANWPAPTLALKEGRKLFLTLTTLGFVHRPDLFDPHSIHWHGIPNAATFYDGEPMASFGVNEGSSFTYYYNITEPGTYMYHCHVEATEHMQMGMLGNLYVTPKQDGTAIAFNGKTFTKFAYNDIDGSTGYDVAYPIQLHAFDPVFHGASYGVQAPNFASLEDRYSMINGRGYPDTKVEGELPALNGALDYPDYNYASQKLSSLIKATAGQRILLRISNLSFDYYTLTALGIPMQVVGRDAKILRNPAGNNMYYFTSSLDLGGGETADVLLDTTGIAPGTYFLYTTNLNFLTNDLQERGGMMTEIVIQ
jgi:FtsP/CotA-like multicopper oxidase with cupredoxin domain